MSYGRPIKIAVFILLIIFIIFGGVIVHRTVAAANTPRQERYYTAVRIEDGDTLWTLAEKYHDGSVAINTYIDDLMRMNGIINDGALVPGGYITIWYYG